MRFTRLLCTFAVLASYVLLAVGVEPLHLSQVGDCAHSCGVGVARQSTDIRGVGSAYCGHPHQALHEQEHSPPQPERHDSSACAVCRILGQAQDRVVPPSLTVNDDVVARVAPSLPDSSPKPHSPGFRCRAPPAA